MSATICRKTVELPQDIIDLIKQIKETKGIKTDTDALIFSVREAAKLTRSGARDADELIDFVEDLSDVAGDEKFLIVAPKSRPEETTRIRAPRILARI
ncbi:hypothetical protein KTR66_16410 [Roseococcus sp. SDR]|uniref:hypothetical protein n=1 Tax=Roseococcus sp. SDR TaxID=2835532 RepID=UPI001BD198A8|nr:hypothetical protein [Roseococcus sp. SDR]MBS7791587.1 hypothetical protein [Roseococcus sp. SDR]MBV1846901.1 hypothetical protein [Roseococcus sp. SDR]